MDVISSFDSVGISPSSLGPHCECLHSDSQQACTFCCRSPRSEYEEPNELLQFLPQGSRGRREGEGRSSRLFTPLLRVHCHLDLLYTLVFLAYFGILLLNRCLRTTDLNSNLRRKASSIQPNIYGTSTMCF